MRRQHLNIKESEAAFPQALDQVIQGDFGCVRRTMEHRFAGEQSSNRHAVDSAGEFAAAPALDAVSVTLAMKRRISLNELRADPSGASAWSGCGATLDRVEKRAIDRDFKSSLTQRSRQATRHMKAVQLENPAWIGRPPSDRVDTPGKDAAAIGQQKPLDGKVTSDRDEPVHASGMDGFSWVGEPELLIQHDRGGNLGSQRPPPRVEWNGPFALLFERAEKYRLEISARLHDHKITRILRGNVATFVALFVRLSEDEPTAHANIV